MSQALGLRVTFGDCHPLESFLKLKGKGAFRSLREPSISTETSVLFIPSPYR
jgi:hypothetical protein